MGEFILENKSFYRTKKVMKIGIVTELTGLSERQVRYYEEKELIFPERTSSGIRKYSFSDIELLIEISKKIKSGFPVTVVRMELLKRKIQIKTNAMRKSHLKAYVPHTCL